MNLSALKLHGYYCPTISFNVNSAVDRSKSLELPLSELSYDSRVETIPDKDRFFQVFLNVKSQVSKGSNSPCSFSVDIIGIFEIHESMPLDRREHFVKVNGSSVLYGAAREVVRSVTGHGPFPPIIIPSASFAEPSVTAPAPQSRIESKIVTPLVR